MFENRKLKKYISNNVKVKYFHVIDSTNFYLKRNINKISQDTLIVAKKQTNGQGRTGKTFYSKSGAYFSLLLNDISLYDLTLLTIKVGVAINRVLNKHFNINSQIKWVNDLYLNGYKFCGILCEKINNKVIIGIGININNNNFPEDIKNIATSILIKNKDYLKLISLIINEIYVVLKENNSNVIKEYTEKMILLNKEITFKINNTNYTGIVKSINYLGNLVVISNNKEIILKSGEVSLTSKHII